jgi:molybdopterin synthase catalytic subunit
VAVEDIVICHRMGRLKVGEITLVIAIAAPHRQEAFAACQYAVDRLKQIAPLWKREATES